ncbi:MAG: hypothetical protein EBZ49_00725 [Proteobacteria bacterium]|nr:hypothetical protein [Pseudomonadota bacterium]
MNQILNRLEELDIHPDHSTAAAFVSAMLEWLTTTNAGKEYFVKLFGFDWKKGQSDHMYELTETREMVQGDDIYFLRAAIVRGMFVPPHTIKVEKMEKYGCDDCGILAHCTRTIDGKHICNRCASLSDNEKVRQLSGGQKECDKCSVQLCEYNPAKNVLRLYAAK